MKLLALIGLSIVYGLLFHVLMSACVVLFGPVPAESDVAFPFRDVIYLCISSLLAAAIAIAAWHWRRRRHPSAADGFAVGTISVLLIVINVVAAKGVDGLATMFAGRPIHAAVSFLVAFFAVPLCAVAAGVFEKR